MPDSTLILPNRALDNLEQHRYSKFARVLCRFLPLALLAGLFPVLSPSPATAADQYSDIPAGIHGQSMEALIDLGIFSGTECETGRICPESHIKRWTMAVWLTRAVDGMEPPSATSTRFDDVKPGTDWWAPHVERLAVLDITKGCGTGRYCPDDDVTRQQMASFLVRAFELDAAGSFGFTDTAGNPHAADIDALAAAGITNGCSKDPLQFCPGDSVTRGQMATFLARALGVVELPAAPSTTDSTSPTTTTTTVPASTNGATPTGNPPPTSDLQTVESSTPSSRESQTLGQIQATRVASAAGLQWYEHPPNVQTRGEQIVDVFYCDPQGRFTASNLSEATRLLNQRVGLFYQWQSSGLFEFTFKGGQILRPTANRPCIDQIRQSNLSNSYLIISDDHDRTYGDLYSQGWTGERGSKVAVLWASNGPTGLEIVGDQNATRYRDYYFFSVIDALAHTHLAVGIYSTGLAGGQSLCFARLESSSTGWITKWPDNPEGFDSLNVGLSCFHLNLLGWPRSTNCGLLPPSPPTIQEFTVGELSATLTWNAPTLRPYDRTLEGYYVALWTVIPERTQDLYRIAKTYPVDADTTSLTMTDLSPIVYRVDLYPLYADSQTPYTWKYFPEPLRAPEGLAFGDLASQSWWTGSEYRSYKNWETYDVQNFQPRIRSTEIEITDLGWRDLQDPTGNFIHIRDYQLDWPDLDRAKKYILGVGDNPATPGRAPSVEIAILRSLKPNRLWIHTESVQADGTTIRGQTNSPATEDDIDLVLEVCYDDAALFDCYDYIHFTITVDQSHVKTPAEVAPEAACPEPEPDDSDVWNIEDRPTNARITDVGVGHFSFDNTSASQVTVVWDPVPQARHYKVSNPLFDPCVDFDVFAPGATYFDYARSEHQWTVTTNRMYFNYWEPNTDYTFTISACHEISEFVDGRKVKSTNECTPAAEFTLSYTP